MSSSLSTLCNKCQVLRFDDAALGGYEGRSSQSKRCLKFDENDRTRHFFLEYFLVDDLPDLHALAEFSEQGCKFCGLLRTAIFECQLDDIEWLEIELEYRWMPPAHPLERGLAGLVVHLNLYPFSKVYGNHTTIWFSVDALPDSPIQNWLKLEVSPRPDALCEENLQMITRELSELPHREPELFIPSRLIDIGDDPRNSKMCLTTKEKLLSQFRGRGPEHFKYAAFSYCWGPPEEAATQIKTERHSLADMMSGISFHSCSRVIQDLITVARVLQLRFLWVDALCIIQDDLADWETETLSMGSVYRHAFVTICPIASQTCQQGFLTRTTETLTIGFKSSIAGDVEGIYTLRYRGIRSPNKGTWWPLRIDLDSAKWDRRGWTFQEMSLSTRLILFGQSKIHFLRSSKVVSEGGEEYEGAGIDVDISAVLVDLHGPKWHDNWRRAIVSEYSVRELTRRTDKLPALSGLARLAAGGNASDYLAGLWKDDLLAGLFWECVSRNKFDIVAKSVLLDSLESPGASIAPSWSWASRDTFVRFGQKDFDTGYEEGFQDFRPEYMTLDAWTAPTGLNPFGEVSNGYLRINGPVCSLPSNLSLIEDKGMIPKRWRASVRGQCIAYCSFDWTLQPQGECVDGILMILLGSCVNAEKIRGKNGRVSEEGSESTRLAFGLILHAAKQPGLYLRVGIFSSWPVERGGLAFFKRQGHRVLEII